MSVETKNTPEIIKGIERVLQGAILGKNKAEKTVRKAILGGKDLAESRSILLTTLTRDGNKNIEADYLNSLPEDELATIIGVQMRAVALSKKEKGAEDSNPERLALRAEIIKDDGFCKRVFEYTQDEAHSDRVQKALLIVAHDLDQDRLDAGVKLHNNTLTQGKWNKIVNNDLIEIKKQRDVAEVGEEIPTLDDKQRERVREHMATKQLLEKEQLKNIRKEIELKPVTEEEEPDEDKPVKKVSLNWNRIGSLGFATVGTAVLSIGVLSEGLLISGLVPEISSGLLEIAVSSAGVGLLSLAGVLALRQLERKRLRSS